MLKPCRAPPNTARSPLEWFFQDEFPNATDA
jgi:hypothetical protein